MQEDVQGTSIRQPNQIERDLDSESAMQERQRNTILINGQEVPTYQYIFEKRQKLKQRIKRTEIVAWVAGLAAAVSLLWR